MICVNWERSLSINFIDIKKAFDSIHRDLLWSILHLYGVLRKFISIFKSLYCHPNCSIKMNTGHTDLFAIETGVRQSPGQARCRHHRGRDQLTYRPWFCRWLVEDGHHLQHPTSNLAGKSWTLHQCRKIMHISDQAGMPKIKIGGQELEVVERFAYLGSVIGWDRDWETHFKSRTGKASLVFQQMWNIWSSASISINIKVH